MSAFGSAVGKAVGALGGPQLAAVIVVGGLLAGAATGGFMAAGSSPSTTGSSTGQLSIYPCPGVGPALQTVPAGQRFLVTGRSEDGQWARIHYPAPGRTEAWVQVSPLTFQAALQSVPVATCAPVTAAAEPSVGPAASLTAIQNNPPSPTPTPVPTATPTPAAPPSLSKLTVSTTKISYDQGGYCPNAAKQVTFTVKGSAGAGLKSVDLFWRAPGAGSYTKAAMSLASGSAGNGTWQVTLDTTVNSITTAGQLTFYALGTDALGKTSRIPSKGTSAITVAVCANTGPTIAGATSSSGSTLRWDPLSVGGCTIATTFSATITDVDGVKSATLYYLRPGSPSWSTKAMTQKAGSNNWSATLNTTTDKITIPTPPTGTLKWYLRAVDGKNLASKTKSTSITIRRCDAAATFYVNSLRTTTYSYCPAFGVPSVTLTWDFSITDPDGLTTAALSYSIVNRISGKRISGSKTITVPGQRFSITPKPIDGATFSGTDTVSWTITTTDQYGGHSSATGRAIITISLVCIG